MISFLFHAMSAAIMNELRLAYKSARNLKKKTN